MTRAKGRSARIVQVEIPGENAEETPDEISEEVKAAEATIAEVRSTQSRAPFAKLYQVDDVTGVEQYVGKFSAATLSEDFLAKRFGGGKYRVQFWKPKTKGGGWQYDTQSTYDIARSVRAEVEPVVAVPAAALGGSDDFIEKMLLQQMQTNAQLMTAIMGAMAGLSAKPAADPVMLAILQGMMQRKDPTEIATALLGVMKESTGTATSPVEQLKQMKEVFDMFGGGGTKEVNELDVVTKGLGVIEAALSARNVPVAPVAPAPEHRALPPALEERPVDPVKIDVTTLRVWHRAVAPLLGRMGQAMAFGLTPHAAADTLWTQAGADVHADLRADLGGQTVATVTDDMAEEFVKRSAIALRLAEVAGNSQELAAWAVDTLYELVWCALEPDGEDNPEGEAPALTLDTPQPKGKGKGGTAK